MVKLRRTPTKKGEQIPETQPAADTDEVANENLVDMEASLSDPPNEAVSNVCEQGAANSDAQNNKGVTSAQLTDITRMIQQLTGEFERRLKDIVNQHVSNEGDGGLASQSSFDLDVLNAETPQIKHQVVGGDVVVVAKEQVDEAAQIEAPEEVQRNFVRNYEKPQTHSAFENVNKCVSPCNPSPQFRDASAYARLVDLPEFSGDVLEWPMFERSYYDTTEEFLYNDRRNLIRLRKALVGEARAAVQSMLPFPESVSEIMAVLKETFGRPEQLMHRQIADVRNLGKIHYGNSIALIKLSNSLKNMVAFAKYGRNEHQLCDSTLLTECVAKLPYEIQIQWAQYRENITGYPTLEALSQFLSSIAKRASFIQDSYQRVDAPSSSSQQNRRGHSKGHMLLAAKSQNCLVCDGECGAVVDCIKFKNFNMDERWEKVKALRLCLLCLKCGHFATKCYSKKRCSASGCGKRHHSLLHNSITTNSTENNKKVTFSGEARTNNGGVWFQILPVSISKGNKTVQTYAFLDQGASHSMIEWSLAEKLGLSGQKDVLEMHWLNNVQVKYPTERVSFQILGADDKCRPVIMNNVFTVRDLSLPMQSVDIGYTIDRKGRRERMATKYTNAVPELVVGLDHANLMVPLETPQVINSGGAAAAFTKLGWVVYGPNCATATRGFAGCSVRSEWLQLEELMRDHLADANLGIQQCKNEVTSQEDERAIQLMKGSTVYEDERYVVGLLWKDDKTKLSNSYPMAERRLINLEKKMTKDPEFAALYRSGMNDYVNKGYARKLSREEAMQESNKTYYLPHFAVKNPNKKKIRIVFDAAAEVNGRSLNDELLSGPDLNTPLLSVLFQFRKGRVAVCADIKEMFLQVAVKSEDQDAQRYLWRNGDTESNIEVYVMKRMLFGAKCSPTLAQYVKNRNAADYVDRFPRAVESIVNHHYVDDLVDAFEDEMQAEQVVKQVIEIHRKGGFELCNFCSNSRLVLENIQDKCATSTVNLQGRSVERVLGMHWDCQSDMFIFALKFHKIHSDVIQQRRPPTKREMLSTIMSIFDPFGLLANFVIGGKILMQSLWLEKLDWDQQVPNTYHRQWQRWLSNLPKVERVMEARCYNINLSNAIVEFHIFSDASEIALAAVGYLRIIMEGIVSVRFVLAKSRCAPIKYTSIPRLELQAAVLAVRVKEIIMANHQFKTSGIYFWTDSTTVLTWLNSANRRYKPYTANRLSEILEYSETKQWNWVPSAENVADDATRVNTNYEPNGRWSKGPGFLWRDKDDWPAYPSKLEVHPEATVEIKNAAQVFVTKKSEGQTNEIDYQRFSNYNRLRRTMAFVLRFGRMNKKSAGETTTAKGSALQAEEIEYAEKVLCKLVQHEIWATEVIRLRRGQTVNKASGIADLNPKLDEMEILRVCGRIEKAECVALAEKRQIILPRKHKFTLLLASYYHEQLRHLNRNTVICEIRRKFWIPAIRILMKTVESACQHCKIRRTKPIPPIMRILPQDRLTPHVRPFSYTGVDFFGPLNVAVRRQREKRWVALFTCLTVRAVHLELVSDLSSDACLVALRNFINRRGVPVMMRSDNGTNFVGLPKELHGVNDFLDYNAIGEGVTNLGIKWRFNCPANPSEGGAWERLVQSVKKVLMIVLRESAPRTETLISVLIECENIVNSRPLTHLPVSSDEEEPLTPNHFLLNTANSTQTPAPYIENVCLRKQWRIAQNLKNGFWHRWIREYLPELTRRVKWSQPTTPLNPGDIVLVCDAAAPRSHWRRGRIVKLIKGGDGICRSAEILTAGTTLRRPISKLAKIDVTAE